MEISVVGGTGYVGLTTAACFAYKGHKVYCIGRNPESIRRINDGIPIIYEDRLGDILKVVTSEKRLIATTDVRDPILKSSVVFICVGTPCGKEGRIDLGQLKAASELVGRSIVEKEDYSGGGCQEYCCSRNHGRRSNSVN